MISYNLNLAYIPSRSDSLRDLILSLRYVQADKIL